MTALARISSFTGRDTQPDALSSPSVAARARHHVEPTPRPPSITRPRSRHPSVGATTSSVRSRAVELTGIWRATEADDDLRRDGDRPRRRRQRRGPRSTVPGHWRNHPEFASQRRSAAVPPPVLGAGARLRPPAVGDARRRLLPGRRVARRRLPRRPRGLLHPAHVRHHRAVADRRRARPRGRGGLPAAAQPPRTSATSPACSSTGTASTATGTPAASGARCASTTPARCASTGSACCAATPTRRARTCCFYARLDCDDRRRVTRAHARRRPSDRRIRAIARRRAQRGQLEPRHRRTRALWWPRSLGDQPLTDDVASR